MFRTFLSSAAALTLLLSTPTLGIVVSGDQLLRWCTDKIPSPPDIGTSPPAVQLRRDMEMTNQFIAGSSIGYCYGYVGGVVDAYDGRTFCLPEGTTAGQFGDIVIQYLRGYPAGPLRSRNAARLASEALEAAFPCH